MSRRHSAEKREIIPDPKFGDIVVTKFMNSIMYEGKKSTAERIVYGAFDIVENRARANPIEVFRAALDNVAPMIEVRSRRVGQAARARNDRTMIERLSGELLDAANNRGNAVKKREDTHRMAEANRAFSHYRW